MLVLIFVLIAFLLILTLFFIRSLNTIKRLEVNALVQQEQTRLAMLESNKKAVEASRRVIKGKISEEIAPLIEGFPYVASDLKFMGMPLDYICFKNYTEVRDGDPNAEIEIIFMDIKTGRASLSTPQKKIKEAVQAGRISGATLRVNEGKMKLEKW